MSEKIDVLQAELKREDIEPIRQRNDMPDIKIGKDVKVSESGAVAHRKNEPMADGEVKPFGLSDKLKEDIETKEKVSAAEIEQIAKDVIKNDVSDKSATPRRHRANKSTK